MSQKSFADLGLSQPVVGALADRGMSTPFAIQSLVIEDVLDGVDVLACPARPFARSARCALEPLKPVVARHRTRVLPDRVVSRC